jgi:hypothetical protein
MRYNNIGVENIHYLETPTVKYKETGLAIVKYHENRYHGMLDTYLNSGWVDEGEHIVSNKIRISKKCFEDAEANYVLAFVRLAEGEDETTLETVGDRLLFIEENEREDFFKAYIKANELLIQN